MIGKKYIIATAMFFAPNFAHAQSAMPALPFDVPSEFQTIGGLLYAAQAAEKCGFRDTKWTQSVARDAGNAGDKVLAQDYPTGVPDQIKLDAMTYAADEMKAGTVVTQSQCQTLQQSGLLAALDAAAQNASSP